MMGSKIIIGIIGFVLGVLAAMASSSYWLHYLLNNHIQPQSIALEESQNKNILLYAELKNGFLIGKYFNKNPEIIVTQITIEAVPKDEKNSFNQFTPRFFNIDAIAMPRTMSPDFKVETGILNPAFHTLQVSEARGHKK